MTIYNKINFIENSMMIILWISGVILFINILLNTDLDNGKIRKIIG